jgi:hypothetical protein
MRRALFTALLFVSFVSLTAVYPEHAQGATFARQSLFLSKTPVTEGETVLIHSVVANESNVKFVGDVVFKDGDTKLGTVAVTIAAGGANTVSVSWKPQPGSHKITAELTADSNTVVESESATFVINAKSMPGTEVSTSTGIDSSKDIQNRITDLLPSAAPVAEPFFSTIDTVRGTAANALDSGINWAKEKTGGKKPGEVLGAATSSSSFGMVDTILKILAAVLLYIFSVLRFVVGNAGLFYPAFALLFLYILWRIYKRMRRPSHPVY